MHVYQRYELHISIVIENNTYKTKIIYVYALLRSSSDNMCAVPRTHSIFGDRSFGAAGLRIWNSLPCGLRTLDISYTNILKHY